MFALVLAMSNAVAVLTQAQEVNQDGSASSVGAMANSFEDRVVYYPKIRPGYSAWVKLFQFGNGDIGLSFDEVRREPNPHFNPLLIEFIEAAGARIDFITIFTPPPTRICFTNRSV